MSKEVYTEVLKDNAMVPAMTKEKGERKQLQEQETIMPPDVFHKAPKDNFMVPGET